MKPNKTKQLAFRKIESKTKRLRFHNWLGLVVIIIGLIGAFLDVGIWYFLACTILGVFLFLINDNQGILSPKEKILNETR